MPVGGRVPAEDRSTVLNKNPLAFEWVDVENVPFAGPVPVKLPSKRMITTPKGSEVVPVLGETRAWWKSLCAMPHCTMWELSDWHFALSTALIADLSFRGVASAAGELRKREKVLGTTVDARRGLRIKYVDVLPDQKADEVAPSNVVSMERRARINAS